MYEYAYMQVCNVLYVCVLMKCKVFDLRPTTATHQMHAFSIFAASAKLTLRTKKIIIYALNTVSVYTLCTPFILRFAIISSQKVPAPNLS